jgi:hypothetical protein
MASFESGQKRGELADNWLEPQTHKQRSAIAGIQVLQDAGKKRKHGLAKRQFGSGW